MTIPIQDRMKCRGKWGAVSWFTVTLSPALRGWVGREGHVKTCLEPRCAAPVPERVEGNLLRVVTLNRYREGTIDYA